MHRTLCRTVLWTAVVAWAASSGLWGLATAQTDAAEPTDSAVSLVAEGAVELENIEALLDAIELAPDEEVLLLSLAECLEIALSENRDVLIATFDPALAEQDVVFAKGMFDPVVEAGAAYGETDVAQREDFNVFGLGYLFLLGDRALQELLQPGNNILGGMLTGGRTTSSDVWTRSADLGVGGLLRTGTRYGITLSLSEEEVSVGMPLLRTSEADEERLVLTVTQPLLRGFGVRVNTVGVRQARNARKMGDAQLALVRLNTVAGVSKAYWGLVGEAENLVVHQASLEAAERLLHDNRARAKIGAASELEVLTAQAGVARRQNDVVEARARMADAGDFLKALLDLRAGDHLSCARVVPADRPTPEGTANLDVGLDERVARALERRPDIAINELILENDDLELRRTRNGLLPTLDVTGAWGTLDQDDRPNDRFSGDSSADSDFYEIGLRGSIPIGNRSARSAHRRARLAREQNVQRFEKLRTELILNVHLALRAVKKNRVLLGNARKTVVIERAHVRAEEERLRFGVTTSYRVLQIQDDLTAAQTRLVQTEVAFQNALVDLRLAEGTLLDGLPGAVDAP